MKQKTKRHKPKMIISNKQNKQKKTPQKSVKQDGGYDQALLLDTHISSFSELISMPFILLI